MALTVWIYMAMGKSRISQKLVWVFFKFSRIIIAGFLNKSHVIDRAVLNSWVGFLRLTQYRPIPS